MREFELRFAPWTTSSRNGGVATFQGQNGGGHARSGQSGQRELEFVVQCDCVRECGLVFGRIASQVRTALVRRCWVRGELKSGAFGENRGDEVAGFGSNRKGATWRAEEDRVLVSRGVCCSWRRGDRIAREVYVRACVADPPA